jgi:hypothetical protein
MDTKTTVVWRFCPRTSGNHHWVLCNDVILKVSKVTLLKTTQILLQFHYLLMFSASIYKFVNLSCQFDKGNSSCIHQSNNHHDQHMLKWGWMEFWLCHKKEGFNKVRNGALRVRNNFCMLKLLLFFHIIFDSYQYHL